MQAFERAEYPEEFFKVERVMARFKCDREAAQFQIERMRKQRTYLNDLYQVDVTDVPAQPDINWPAMLGISIKRRDKEPIHDWRQLQEIKNAIIGPGHEAVELYPAESRKVDTANQYYLFALKDPTLRFPFGFTHREIATPEEAAEVGAKQRPFEE